MRLFGIKYCQERNVSRYDIYLLQHTKEETIHKTIQNHRIYKKTETNIQNKKTNKKRKLKKI